MLGSFLAATSALAQVQIEEAGQKPKMGGAEISNPAAASAVVSPGQFQIKTADGKYQINLNTVAAPELTEWADHKLAPVLADWYPKIVALLPSPNFSAPASFSVTIKPMAGVAYTSGTNIVASAAWLKSEIGGEAIGSLVHELVHVVQHYGRHPRPPGWLVEGLADYIRWFKFEPQSHGADLVWMRKHGKHFSSHYNDSYRITANFLDWATKKYDSDLVAQLNAAIRAGHYDAEVWKRLTGKSVEELGAEWKTTLAAQLPGPGFNPNSEAGGQP